jgi:putative transposase
MRQLALPIRTHGGKRRGAGRKRRSEETVAHASREPFEGKRHPLHVTLKLAKGCFNLRSERGFACVHRALRAEQRKGVLRVVHYSVQGNHVHLIAETNDRRALGRRMKGFGVRFARAMNRMMRRRGRVLAERYHVHVLRTRSEVRNAVRYVLHNHVGHHGVRGAPVDPYSSAPFVLRRVGWLPFEGPPPLSDARTWMLRVGVG